MLQASLTQPKPLYLTDLIQENNPPVAFVAGTKGGLCELTRL